jgi:hypothetical protein
VPGLRDFSPSPSSAPRTPSSSAGASEHWHSAELSFRDSTSVAQLHGHRRGHAHVESAPDLHAAAESLSRHAHTQVRSDPAVAAAAAAAANTHSTRTSLGKGLPPPPSAWARQIHGASRMRVELDGLFYQAHPLRRRVRLAISREVKRVPRWMGQRAQCARVGKCEGAGGAGRRGRQQEVPAPARYPWSGRSGRCGPLEQRALPPAVPPALPVGRAGAGEFSDRRVGWVWLGLDG